MTFSRCRRALALALVLATLSGAAALAAGQRRPGRIGFELAPRTDAGNWYGTWGYKSRDQRIVLWIRQGENGKPEYRLQYQSLSGPEAFTTGWDGRADYNVAGSDGHFHLVASEAGADRIAGTLDWDLQRKRSGRKRTGEFEMYRSRDGRNLVMHLFNQTLTIRRNDKAASDESPSAWTFVKISRRLIRWEEVF